MDKVCFLCLESKPGPALIFNEKCERHALCFDCFYSPDKINKIDKKGCNECHEYFFPSNVYPSRYPKCLKCVKRDKIEVICPYHPICKECFFNTGILENYNGCYNCRVSTDISCKLCLENRYPDILQNPYHPSHSYCIACFKNETILQFSNCKDCKTRPPNFTDENNCTLCYRFALSSSRRIIHGKHYLCILCYALLAECKYLNRYLSFIYCEYCVRRVKAHRPQVPESFCRNCLKDLNTNEKITILSCPLMHAFCQECLTGPIERFSCKFCEVYYTSKPKESCCIFCKKPIKYNKPLNCRKNHIICDICENFILKNNPELYLSISHCDLCANALAIILQNEPNLSKQTIVINKDLKKIEGNCSKCLRKKNCLKTCTIHKFCLGCLRTNAPEEGYFKISCHTCLNYFHNACKSCFCLLESGEKLEIKECSKSHFYCQKCIISEKLDQDVEMCPECLDAFNRLNRNVSVRRDYNTFSTIIFNQTRDILCIYCSNKRTCFVFCSAHKFCIVCFKFNPENLNEILGSCKMCTFFIEKACRQCYEIVINKKITNQFCKLQHFYCQDCADKDNSKNQDFCNFCRETYDNIYKNLHYKSCEICSYKRLCPINCENHAICIKCYEGKKIQQDCNKCQEIIELACKSCFSIIRSDSLKLINPACKKKHLYCQNCFVPRNQVPKNISCENCKSFYDKVNKKHCIMCTTRQGIRLCDNHQLCDNCKDLLNFKNILVYAQSLNCEACSKKLILLIPINFNEEHLDPQLNSRDPQNINLRKSGSFSKGNNKSLDSSESLKKVPISPEDRYPMAQFYPDRQVLNSADSLNQKNKWRSSGSHLPIGKIARECELNSGEPFPQRFLTQAHRPALESGYLTTQQIFEPVPDSQRLQQGAESVYVIPQKFFQPKPDFQMMQHGFEPGYATTQPFFEQVPDFQRMQQSIESVYVPPQTFFEPTPGFQTMQHGFELRYATTQAFSDPAPDFQMLQQSYFKSLKMSSCCNGRWPALACNHPMCNHHLGSYFAAKFEEFMQQYKNSNLDWLNSQEFGIGCYKPNCYLKFSFPFLYFKHIALEIAGKYSLGEEFCDHYASLFEGIKYEFRKCGNCNLITGSMIGNECIWCKSLI